MRFPLAPLPYVRRGCASPPESGGLSPNRGLSPFINSERNGAAEPRLTSGGEADWIEAKSSLSAKPLTSGGQAD
jgi:hypothetical protein